MTVTAPLARSRTVNIERQARDQFLARLLTTKAAEVSVHAALRNTFVCAKE